MIQNKNRLKVALISGHTGTKPAFEPVISFYIGIKDLNLKYYFFSSQQPRHRLGQAPAEGGGGPERKDDMGRHSGALLRQVSFG